ncbi:lgrA, partial [Symbiodinium natans]
SESRDREPQEAPVPGDLSAEDALRLQARPSEGSNLGFGEWLDEDAWVPEELPPTSDSGQWERLRAQTSRRGTAASSDEAEASEEREEPSSAARVIPPTEAGHTEPARSGASVVTLTHQPTSLWDSESEGEIKQEVKKEEQSGNTSDWESESSEEHSTDPEDPNGVQSALKKADRARERREQAKRHKQPPPEPSEPPRAKARPSVGRSSAGAASSWDLESRASSVGWRRQVTPSFDNRVTEEDTENEERSDEQWSRQDRERDRLWNEWYRARGTGGWHQWQGSWYQSSGAGWHLANPSFPSDIAQWSTALHQWEAELREFERTYNTAFSEDEKVSILAHIAPKELQQSIFMHSDVLNGYDKIREYIEQYLINRNLWKRPQGSQFGMPKASNKTAEHDDGGVRPMDIGGVKGDKGKGKGEWKKGKDHWGDKGKDNWSNKGKDKWKEKWNNNRWDNNGKGKGKDGKKGKTDKGKGAGNNNKGGKGKQNDGKGKNNNPHAGKQCHICHRHGHIAADCWWKVGAVDNEAYTETGGTGASTAPEDRSGNGAGIGSVFEGSQRVVKWSDEDVIFTVSESSVAAVTAKQLGNRYLLIDSGACESVAKVGDFEAQVDASKAKPLFSVQGTPLKVYGKQYPQVMFGQTKGAVEMTVTDAAESLVSVHSLVARGHKVVFSPGGCFLETSAGDTVPLELHGKRWYLKVMDVGEGSAPAGGWHNSPRKRLFAPKIKDLPVPLERLESGRLTKMIFEEDGSQKEDRSAWEDKRFAMRDMKHAWLGETWFRLKPEREEAAAEEEQPDYEGEWMQGLDEAYEEEIAQGEEAHGGVVEDDEDAVDRLMIDEDRERDQSKVIKAPKEPSAQEVEEHNLHHANFESWCPVCVMGQGKSKQHRRVKEDPKEHVIYSDYMFFSGEGKEVNKEEGEKKRAGLVTVLTAICKESQYPFALVLPSKASVDYASKAMISWIKDLKWDKVVIHFDQESALNKIYERVQKEMGDTVTLRRSPRYSSQSLADGEMVNGFLAGKIRTWLAEVSEKYKVKIGCDSVLFPWIVRHSAWTVARFHINHSKTTAFRVINGFDYVGEMMTFGQVSLAKFPKQKDKAAPRWIRGVYAGKNAAGDEHLVLTESGVQTCRTVRRLPESARYEAAILNKAKGVPWNRYLGIATSKVVQERSESKGVAVPELEPAETYDFKPETIVVPMPAPRAADDAGKESEKAALQEPESKRARVEPAQASRPPGDTGNAAASTQQFNIATPDASMGTDSLDTSMYVPSVPGDVAQNMVDSVSNHGTWLEGSALLPKEDVGVYKKWLKQNKDCFNETMVSNIMDYLDTLQIDEKELRRARKEELRKLNEVYGAFTPRDGRQITKDLTVFGHKWVDKVTEGQPVMMKPPKEWLEEYDEWYAKASPEMQEQMKNVPKESVLWQVDGNLYGRQSAAAQYRDRLETILTKELPKGVYQFHRGTLDACVFRCVRTGIVLIHHIDDFDVCGPAELLDDLLKVQLPKCGCKLKVGELEWPGAASSSTSEFLGRKKILVEGAVVTMPNEKHTTDILRMLGLEAAKPSPVPGKKLNLKDDKLLEGRAKEIYASCVGSATYLSQDRPDIKFACKELAKRIRNPRECDMQNLKTLGRYLRGTMHVGHVTKMSKDFEPDLVFVRNLGVEDFGMTIDVPRLFCDSSAAIQVARRLVLGKCDMLIWDISTFKSL